MYISVAISKPAAQSLTRAPSAPASDSVPPPPALSPDEVRALIESDLAAWSATFAAAADKTLADLEATVDAIAGQARAAKAAEADAAVAALQAFVADGLAALRTRADALVLADDSDALAAAARTLGTEIRDRTHAIRQAAEQHVAGAYAAVSAAAAEHLAALDGVGAAGMHELGRKWAWAEHVRYQDWARYHALQTQLADARAAVVPAAAANARLLQLARWAERQWGGRATDVAQAAADELRAVKAAGKAAIAQNAAIAHEVAAADAVVAGAKHEQAVAGVAAAPVTEEAVAVVEPAAPPATIPGSAATDVAAEEPAPAPAAPAADAKQSLHPSIDKFVADAIARVHAAAPGDVARTGAEARENLAAAVDSIYGGGDSDAGTRAAVLQHGAQRIAAAEAAAGHSEL